MSSTFGTLSNPRGVAIDQSNGDVFVADTGNNRVDEFGPSGNFLLAFGANVGGTGVNTCTSGCQPGTAGTAPGQFTTATFVAVDNDSSSGSYHDIYVGDTGDNRVSKFDSSGNLITAWGTGGQLSGSSSTTFGALDGVTVDSGGNLIVLDTHSEQYVFSQSGASTSQTSLARSTFPDGVAVDGAENFFKVNYDSVEKFGSLSSDIGQVTPSGPTPTGLAVDLATGDLFVDQGSSVAQYHFAAPGEVLEPDGSTCSFAPFSGCNPTSSFAIPFTGGGMTVNSASGDIYISDPSAGDVYRYRLVTLPDVTTGQATNIQPSSATLNGIVNPDGTTITDCHVEYVDDAHYEPLAANPYSAGQTASCASTPTGSSPVAVSANISGLSPDTSYHFRLVAANADGATDGADQTFETTGPPTIQVMPADHQAATGATAHASVDPHGFDTTYYFQYGTTTAYGQTTAAGQAGAGTTYQLIATPISGLQPGTTYHYRAVATNSAGTVTSADYSFTTPPAGCANAAYRTGLSAGLPDCRAYELVSPTDKGGYPVTNPEIAASGDRVAFASNGAFAGAGSNGAFDHYVAVRGTTGWSTQSVEPPASLGSNVIQDVQAGAPDLTEFASPLFNAPSGLTNTATAFTLYLRLPDGRFQAITPALSNTTGGPFRGAIVVNQASADFSAFVLASGDSLLASDTEPANTDRLYEVTGANTATQSIRQVNLDNSGDPIVPCTGASLALAGQGSPVYTPAISADGSRVVFWANDASTGCRWQQLYDRVDGTSTVTLSAPSPNNECTTPACQSAPNSDAEYMGASADGSKVFFESTRQLTDNASQGAGTATEDCQVVGSVNGCNLYEYDFNRPAGHNLVDLSAGDASGIGPQVRTVARVSDDGSHVYFVAGGVLTPEPNALGQVAQPNAENLYVYDTVTNQVQFIGDLCTGSRQSGAVTDSSCPGSGVDVGYLAYAMNANPDTTPDGRYLVFSSYAQLTPDDTNQAQDVYEYDSQTGGLWRVSVGHDGQDQNGNGGGQDASAQPFQAGLGLEHHVVSADGQTIVFTTARPLDIRAANGQPDAYEWHQGQVSLVSGSGSSNPVAGAAIDPSGQDITFATDQGLLPVDTDGLADVYDARVNGGFAAPPAPPAPCWGDVCQGSPAGAPALPTVASVSFSGPGDVSSAAGGSPGRARVLTNTVRGDSFLVAVRVPAAGRITITGHGISSVSRLAPKAGTYRLRVRLTAVARRSLARRHTVKLVLRVGYAPAGAGASVATVRLTVKPEPAKRHAAARATRRPSHDHGGAR